MLELVEKNDGKTINGYIERVTYYNKENGFAVAKLQETDKKV